ncbi:MAG: hypothetical protein ACYTFM_02565 [Planctomycetota bacterium]|jgi:hypothetical protein
MRRRFYFVYIICFCTAVLIFTVYLRGAERRIFYEICSVQRQQHLLKQQLWQKQLQLEGSINPAAISERLGNQE